MKRKTTGALIKEGLKNKGMTAAELSRQTGIGKSSLSYYINNLSEPDSDKRAMIFSILGIIEEPDKEPTKRERRPDSLAPSVAAKYLGKSTPFVYEGLKDRRFPWGYAVEMPGGQWSYWISRKRFFEETGIQERLEIERNS